MLTRPLLLTNTKPIAQNVGPQSGFSTSHRLGFWLVAQLQSLTHTVNDGIKLFVIIEHVMKLQEIRRIPCFAMLSFERHRGQAQRPIHG